MQVFAKFARPRQIQKSVSLLVTAQELVVGEQGNQLVFCGQALLRQLFLQQGAGGAQRFSVHYFRLPIKVAAAGGEPLQRAVGSHGNLVGLAKAGFGPFQIFTDQGLTQPHLAGKGTDAARSDQAVQTLGKTVHFLPLQNQSSN